MREGHEFEGAIETDGRVLSNRVSLYFVTHCQEAIFEGTGPNGRLGKAL